MRHLIHRNAPVRLSRPAVTTIFVPDPDGEQDPGDRPDGDARRDGEDSQPGRQWRVVADELEVLRHEEDEAEQREVRERHRRAGRGEAPVAEQRDVEHGLVATPLPHHEHGDHGRAANPPSVNGASQPRSGASITV